MLKRIVTVVAALVLAWAASAQEVTSQRTLPLVVNYDLDSASYIYCKQVGAGAAVPGNPTGDVIPKDRYQKITTSGSSTTVTAYDAATDAPFDPVAVGSIIYFTIPSTSASLAANAGPTARYLTAKASADSVTVNTAVELPTEGVFFSYTTQSCGTAATDGWFAARGWLAGTALLEVTQINTTTGIDYTLECKGGMPWSTAVTVITSAAPITAAGTKALVWSEPYDFCRVGLKLNTTDDGSDTGADAEKVFLSVIERR